MVRGGGRERKERIIELRRRETGKGRKGGKKGEIALQTMSRSLLVSSKEA